MYRISIQRATRKAKAPDAADLRRYAKLAISSVMPAAEVTIRIVNETEMLKLNSYYRKKDYATNVLSFPFSEPDEIEQDIPMLGDIVICAAVVNAQAKAQHKTEKAHWAHMVVHGCLHLLGYDHENDADAEVMESLETTLLKQLRFKDPYTKKGREK